MKKFMSRMVGVAVVIGTVAAVAAIGGATAGVLSAVAWAWLLS